MILGALFFAAVLGWDLYTDYHKWLDGATVYHAREAWIRVLLLVPSILALAGFTPSTGFWKRVGSAAFMVGAWFWLLFDSIYNLLRGYGIFFNGSDDPGDSVLDNFLQSIPDLLEAVIKFGLVILSTFIYVYVKMAGRGNRGSGS